jgi:ATP-dependent DNA helicase RecG
MLIVNPERYGVSQIHQLRGRVSRKGGHGYLFLHVADEIPEDAVERLSLLEECSDGFELAERDMDMRGFGDIEADSESQTGSSRTLFWGVNLTHKELAEASARMGVT